LQAVIAVWIVVYSPGTCRTAAGDDPHKTATTIRLGRMALFILHSFHYGSKASAKLQVRPILLKKISFMIFFNNYPSTYDTID
jgi:hypothetical protein